MPLLTADAKGVYAISVTPFHPDGRIDFDSLDRVTDFYLEKGATGLTILGIMGEAQKLTQHEARDVARRVIARASVPVVVGVSAPGLAAITELSASVMDMGAAGVMVAPPGNLRTDAQIRSYYAQAVAAAGEGVPVVLQDYPLITGVQMDTAVIGQIVTDHPQVVMLKHEDWPGLAKITAIRKSESAGQRRISILCGNGGLFLPEEMGRGANGAMTGFAFPEMLAQVVALCGQGQAERAQDIFDAHLPLVRYEQQPVAGLAVRKYVLARRGAIASEAQRAPGANLPAEARAEVDRMMARLDRRLAELA
ncbi:4-hydroxy-tetrahydrodipicolinate synthase [Gemmobacter megaterium]|uniref:4-hydroxy-tetrahydrodipicolinate synthase n=1 Tax=Gemmobacter megaterium TaxID=1086013 RepID=A0A1N7PSS0_9RHOB|nr:dihydrodipicolinate synthase family protein [Gemmobacter megaterium]GGE21112.1 dihydrodipicolinate synthase family protein [Gemmobacter megaterium]SIT13626.1 4-hydroxy-tetrahydrodipicolinate synthase [Gemmobacter megaterium]